MTLVAPVAVELGWFLVCNVAGLPVPPDDVLERYRVAATLPDDPVTRIRLGIELIWERFDGPLFVASMELWTAARTDPELRAALLPHERRLGTQLRELSVEVFGEQVARHPASEAVYQVLLTAMRGQALTHALQPDAPRKGPHLQHWLAIVDAFTPAAP